MTFESYQTLLTPVYANHTDQNNSFKGNYIFNLFYFLIIIFFIESINYASTPSSSIDTNFLGLLVFCALFGNVVGRMGDRGKELHNFFESLSRAFLQIIRIIIL